MRGHILRRDIKQISNNGKSPSYKQINIILTFKFSVYIVLFSIGEKIQWK